MEKGRPPLVYACAGCSSAGKLSYEVARELDRRGAAEMSCLAGIGAKLPVFLGKLTGRDAWIIDGCAIECARGVFEQAARPVSRHIRLRDYGIRKQSPEPTEQDVSAIADRVLSTD